ncbi:MAG: hypothetical protein R3321_11990 [Nitrososphaeraceae archaeon]|nr:hypothetical protein [Nitrososphaeraceae archaeon]
MKRIVIISVSILAGIISLFIVDPAIVRELSFDQYTSEYEWHLFNNSFCNLQSSGHCHTNKTNKINAEVELWLQLLSNYRGEEKRKKKLKEVVNNSDYFHEKYYELTQSKTIEIDSLIKYKKEIFSRVVLK